MEVEEVKYKYSNDFRIHLPQVHFLGSACCSVFTSPHLRLHLSLASELTFFVLLAGHFYEWKYKGNLHKTYKPQSIIRYLTLYYKTWLYEVSSIRIIIP